MMMQDIPFFIPKLLLKCFVSGIQLIVKPCEQGFVLAVGEQVVHDRQEIISGVTLCFPIGRDVFIRLQDLFNYYIRIITGFLIQLIEVLLRIE